MLNTRDEDRILHGLYHWREMINEDVLIKGDEILWLAATPPDEHRHAEFGSLDLIKNRTVHRFRALTADQKRPLDHLEAAGFIKLERQNSSMFVVKVTGPGALRARRYHTWWGRIDLWFRDNKDGPMGLVLPAVIALIVSLLANWTIYEFHWR
jgi:hypothetical protein